MLSTLLLMTIVVCWLISLRAYGAFSLMTAGLVGFTAYSLPAVMGLTYPFHFQGSSKNIPLIAASSGAIGVTLVAWITFACVLAAPRMLSLPSRKTNLLNMEAQERRLILALLILSVAGLLAIAAVEGPMFFLAARSEQTESIVKLLWRWVNAMGLIISVVNRQWLTSALFAGAIALYYIAGDRTVVVISMMAVFVVLGRNASALRALLRPSTIIAAITLVGIAFFGKAIYLSVKAGNLDQFYASISPEGLEMTLKAFEPFGTFNILDLVVLYDFTVSASVLFDGLMGQLLVVPSYFGFESNAFNREFTTAFASMLTYGIAGNYWAQAYSVAGYLLVVIYSVLFGSVLRFCDYKYRQSSGTVRLLALILGALVAVYTHRNSLDNLLSFVRQILIVALLAVIISRIIAAFDGSAQQRAVSSRPPRRGALKSPQPGITADERR